MFGATERLHATAIAIGDRAALLRGRSGSGKSDLALRCIFARAPLSDSPPALLVADDQTIVIRNELRLLVSAPATTRGLLEVRGVGIVTVASLPQAELALIVDLDAPEPQPRLPDPWPTARILGLDAPLLRLSAFEASAPARLIAALTLATLPPLSIGEAQATR